MKSSLLLPAFENAFWRAQSRALFRVQEGFSKKKGHFEPEEHNSYAERWSEELTRSDSSEEIRQVYENAVVILGNRRSQMERSDRSLECPQLRYQISASQDPEDAAKILTTRLLFVVAPLNKLPEHFDDLFPYKPTELVVPVAGQGSRKEILLALEEWEAAHKGRLTENAAQTIYRLELNSGFHLSVDLERRETSFGKTGCEGVCGLGMLLAKELKALKIPKQLF